MNIIKGKLIKQNGLYFAKFSNTKYTNFCAYIINQKDVKCLTGEIEGLHVFDVIGLIRPSKGFQNLHIYRINSCYNLIGTNENIEEFKDLLKCNFIPSLVNFVK